MMILLTDDIESNAGSAADDDDHKYVIRTRITVKMIDSTYKTLYNSG